MLLGCSKLGALGACAAVIFSLTLHAQRQDRRDLTGVWIITLDITGPGHPGRISGQIAFVPVRAARPIPGFLEPVTHVGVHNLHLDSLGVSAPRGEQVVVAASDAEGRPIIVVISPGGDHGSLVMRGLARGDSITGSWYVTAYALGSRGEFRMRRLPGS